MDGSRKVLAIFALVVLIIALGAPALAQSAGQAGRSQASAPAESKVNLLATAQNISDVSMFVAAVKASGYDQMLSQNKGPIMVLAPTDKALQRDLGASAAAALASDPKAAKALVENCIVPKLTEPARGATTITLTSISGKQIIAKKTSAGITANGIKVSNATVATNGILAVTDSIVVK